MDKLKVAFLDFWPEIIDENIFLPILKKHFDVEVTTNNPDVVIHSIFGGMKQSPNYKCKKILFIGENYRAKNYESDYSISFDHHDEKNYRLPLWQFYLILRPELKEVLINRSNNTESFERFCSFSVSNPANFFRNAFFDQLHQYKRVNSYGRFKTNDLGLQQASQGKYWRDAKYDFFLKHTHKFAITYEHSSYPYYCTEKLMDGFLAGSIPIYWGSTTVHEEFNEKSFVNVIRFSNKDLIEYIKLLDNDKNEFLKVYSEPIFTEEQKKRCIDNIDQFENWLVTTIKK
jgi:alpha(1,3/1,4) fucosyltransferase